MGEFTENENPLDAAKREYKEETGKDISGENFPLTPLKQKSGKLIYAWAIENDFNPEEIISNTFELEWPAKSGIYKSFPEVDKASWFNVTEAKEKIIPGQAAFIDELLKKINQ